MADRSSVGNSSRPQDACMKQLREKYNGLNVFEAANATEAERNAGRFQDESEEEYE